MNILFVFSTLTEATPFIQQTVAQQSENPHLYHFDHGSILISGMGLLSASIETTKNYTGFNEIWNAGIAGSLSDQLEIGTIHSIRSFSRAIFKPAQLDTHSCSFSSRLFPTIDHQQEGLRLCTVDFPIHQQKTKQLLANEFDLVDMEGYGIAFAAQRMNIPFRAVKLISDLCNEDTGPSAIREKIHTHTESLADRLLSDIRNEEATNLR